MLKLNYGSGEQKLKGFINIDCEKKTKPDLVCDIRMGVLPYKSNTVDFIQCIHCIEHIEYQYHTNVLSEFFRVLKPGATLFLAYPEFMKCVKLFMGANGRKDFFRATLYGRQSYPGDYHVTPMVTKDFIKTLYASGFGSIKYKSEPKPNTFYTILKAVKRNAQGREHILREEIYGIK